MKIVHLIGYFQPEFGYKEYYIARNQVKAGHEVHLITSDRVFPFPNYAMLANKLGISESRKRGVGDTIIDGIKVHRLPTIFEVKDSIIIKDIGRKLREINPKIVHAYAPVQISPLLASRYKKKLGYFLIFEEQQFETHRSFLGAIRFIFLLKPLAKKAFKEADVVFCPSNAAIEFVKSQYGLARDRIEFVSLGVDTDFYYFDKEEREGLRRKLRVNNSEILLISTGRISAEKKFELVMKSLREINSEKVKYILVGSGDESYVARLKGLVAELGLQNRVIFHQFVPERELYKFYSAADIGVWPARPTIGMINAIGCELPILIPNHPTVTHLVEEGNGLIFRLGELGALTKKLNKMINSRQMLKFMRQRAKTVVNKKYSYAKLALKDLEVYGKSRKISN